MDSLSGILSVAKGGTGVESLAELKNILGISDSSYKIVYGAVYFTNNWAYIDFSQFTSTPTFVCSIKYNPSAYIYLIGIRIDTLTATNAKCYIAALQSGKDYFTDISGTLNYIAIGI